MPELPEVETIVQKLQKVLPGKTITAIMVFHPKSLVGNSNVLIGLPILEVTRRAKVIRLQFPQNLNVLIHLKMTGQLIFVNGDQRVGGGHPTADWTNALPSKHTRVQIDFGDGSTLFFNDQRLFGWLKVMSDAEVEHVFSQLAPDITDLLVTTEYLATKLKNRSQAIKQLIMDTSVVSGVGNIYACDALNLARIHPERPAKSLNADELDRLVTAMKKVISLGIELGGTTFDGKYVDIDGLAGNYQSVVRVYGREGKECIYCQGEIIKTKLGGRGTYYCNTCQT